jgi:large subunit ribosomal protein L1
MGKTKTAFIGEEKVDKNKKVKHEKEEKIHIAGLKGGQRVKIIETENPVEAETKEKEEAGKIAKGPRERGKKYLAAKAKINHEAFYPLKEAVTLAKEASYSKFDGTMELHLTVRKVPTTVNVTLPFSAGKQKRIEIASEETLTKLAAGKIDFDVLVATAEMMPKLVPFAKILGPKGLMPNPKNGTLLTDSKKAKEFSGNSVNLKTEKEAPLIHTTFGKVSQKESELLGNLEAIFKPLNKQVVKAYIKATMGPSVKIKL